MALIVQAQMVQVQTSSCIPARIAQRSEENPLF